MEARISVPRLPRSFTTERIFPIRRLVDEVSDWSESSDPSPEELVQPEEDDIQESDDGFEEPPYPPVPPQHSLKKLPKTDEEDWPSDSLQNEEGQPRTRVATKRSQLVPQESGGEPGVLPGYPARATKRPLIKRCEDEPIHIPGAIQQYGALIACRYDEYGRLQVRVASENCKSIIGYGIESLFALHTFTDIIAEAQVGDFLKRVDHSMTQGNPSGNTNLDVFELTLKETITKQENMHFWCAIHLSAGTEDICICEFEPKMDLFFPGELDRTQLPHEPVRTLDHEILEEEKTRSTTKMSQPLRALQIAQGEHFFTPWSMNTPMARVSSPSVHRPSAGLRRALGYAEAEPPEQKPKIGFMEMFNAMSQIQSQFAACNNVQELLDVVVGVVSEVSGFHRVMVYRFDQVANGCVVAELVDKRASDDLFRGLNFPASDIPKQARDLYKINKIRILFDRDHETARLIGRYEEDFQKPLDLTHAVLRAMSPIHLSYLRNMGVRSSMSVSLIVDDKLWGLIACHSYGPEGNKISLPIRELCRNIGESASLNVARLLLVQRLKSRRPPPLAIHGHHNPSAFIAASSADLLRIFDADFGILSIQDEGRAIGRLQPYREALALLVHLQKKRLTTIMATQNVEKDFPTLKYAPGIKSIAGLMFVPLSMSGTDFIVFFRRGQLKEVRWAGNPYEKIIRAGTEEYLEPRSSFKRWTETVMGISREWTEDQLETAAILSLLYGRFIDVWRQKELATQRSRMTRLLIQNSSHEVRTPLNAIVNYLEIAMESPLDYNIRESLENAHRASKGLVYVIDDLLNLANAEITEVAAPQDTFDLRSTVADVISSFQKEAMRKELELTVSIHQGLPHMVRGDSSRFRQVLTNLAENALQHTTTGEIIVDVRPKMIKDMKSIISITVLDAGSGMSETQLDELFQEFEQILDDGADIEFDKLTLDPEFTKKQALGLGLSIVARYVRNLDGKLRVQSEEGKGTQFTLELPFDHAPSIETINEDITILPITSGEVIIAGGSPTIEVENTSEDPLASTISWTLPVFENAISRGGPIAPGNNLPTPPRGFAFRPRRSESSNPFLPLGSTPLSSGSTDSRDTYPFPDMAKIVFPAPPLHVLIAEDNPVNLKVLTRRLERSGHHVTPAADGQSCHDDFASAVDKIDVILMDIQMPLVDGEESTRMIRATERAATSRKTGYRVPIIAVSASLKEEKRYDYVADGFDGWLLKPVDFGRLEILLRGVKDQNARLGALYTGAEKCWESGGWLLP